MEIKKPPKGSAEILRINYSTGGLMRQAEILQFIVMDSFFNRLCNLTDSELMTRKQAEMEMQRNLKRVNKEITRRNCEI